MHAVLKLMGKSRLSFHVVYYSMYSEVTEPGLIIMHLYNNCMT